MTQAKTELQSRARELRRAGRTYDEIVAELGVSKSSVSLWVRDLPKPDRKRAHAKLMAEARREPLRRARELKRRQAKEAAKGEIGRLADRELFIAGIALYWAEGTKSKPHHTSERVVFVNSDPDMISLYLAWLRLLGVDGSRLRFHVMIHESADVTAAESFWAEHVGHVGHFGKTTLKKHNPKLSAKTSVTAIAAASPCEYWTARTCTVASKAGGTA
ncbi:hypothetical protein GCM10010324_23460 [Streptomyces hiroshimensis]|uniref:Uncharacterized protein n=1 Tax=Streptomyces hiroshimensis TaxID=66424 RepID=A0ABQ2YBQ7_9ACTN|nr:hypothetical protein GCM10010324_23460 [Streptomyces hiroshimensis]